MKILVITNDFYPINKPTAKMVLRILLCLSTEYKCNFTVVSYALNEERINITNDIENVHVFNFASIEKIDKLRSFVRFFYKIIRKFYSLAFPQQFYECKRLYKKAISETKNKHFDAILAFSGFFAEHKAAYTLSKKTGVPLFLFYADPFFFNVAFKQFKKKRLLRMEEKWILSSKKCFLPHNYIEHYLRQYPYLREKFCECELAGFFDDKELETINNCTIFKQSIVYAGSFFYNWRRPDTLIELATALADFKFVVLGKLDFKKFGYNYCPQNISVIERLSGEDYLKVIGEASALFLEDNSFPEQIPYKAFEYISTNKPVLYSTSNLESSLSSLLAHCENVYWINLYGINKGKINKWLNETIDKQSRNDNDYFKRFHTDYIARIIWESLKQK